MKPDLAKVLMFVTLTVVVGGLVWTGKAHPELLAALVALLTRSMLPDSASLTIPPSMVTANQVSIAPPAAEEAK